MAIDPVCLMEVDEATAKWTSEYKGQTYYFCAPGCKASFDEDPEKYLSGDSAAHDHTMHEGHDHEHSMHADHDHSAHGHAAHDHAAHDHSSDNHH